MFEQYISWKFHKAKRTFGAPISWLEDGPNETKRSDLWQPQRPQSQENNFFAALNCTPTLASSLLSGSKSNPMRERGWFSPTFNHWKLKTSSKRSSLLGQSEEVSCLKKVSGSNDTGCQLVTLFYLPGPGLSSQRTRSYFALFFCPHPQHVDVPRPGIEP